MIGRPIVAVRNGRVDSVYTPEGVTGKPVFVVNYGNGHFEGYKPNNEKLKWVPGEVCNGRQVNGNYRDEHQELTIVFWPL